jgi:hypothetical protein
MLFPKSERPIFTPVWNAPLYFLFNIFIFTQTYQTEVRGIFLNRMVRNIPEINILFNFLYGYHFDLLMSSLHILAFSLERVLGCNHTIKTERTWNFYFYPCNISSFLAWNQAGLISSS